jgi:hypothetical protein
VSNWWGFVGSETKIDKSNTIGWTWGDILFVIVTAWMCCFLVGVPYHTTNMKDVLQEESITHIDTTLDTTLDITLDVIQGIRDMDIVGND